MKLIAAVSKNWGIGKDGDLLFSIPADMKFFRETTSGATVIMGRKTLDSFPGGRPLKNRVNIVLTHDFNFNRDGVIVCHSEDEVLKKAAEYENVFVIGGESVYSLFLEDCDTAYITKVDEYAEADTFLPDLDGNPEWHLESESEPMSENGHKFTFCTYKKGIK